MRIGDIFGIDPDDKVGGIIVLRPDTRVTEENSPWLKGASLMATVLNEICAVTRCKGCGGFNIATYAHVAEHDALELVIAIAVPVSMVDDVRAQTAGLDVKSVEEISSRKEDDEDKRPGSSPLPNWLS
jgi:hypothetical protein